MIRSSNVSWHGDGKDGVGSITTESLALDNAAFSFGSRFAEGGNTNPEELIAAAHASCFTMKLSFVLGESGFVAEKIQTKALITLENGTTISKSQLIVKAKVPGISDDIFKNCVREAELNCPVSRLLKAEVTVECVLE